ncbi:hypothetical protein GDO78_019042 [Eleutherodactylus coqui]|uniref:Uncharacterized protein n=1 Tax=Eleutherodactylus coqui TaxID=57060 RepID=A0A8J6B9M7_ELECQ|nr:hypothetical protein GDO78_019042 [Eleutherodactylus coqui]
MDHSMANFRARSSSSGTYSPARPKHRAAMAAHTPAATSLCVADIPGSRGSGSTGLHDHERLPLGAENQARHPGSGEATELPPALLCATYSCSCRLRSAMSAAIKLDESFHSNATSASVTWWTMERSAQKRLCRVNNVGRKTL